MSPTWRPARSAVLPGRMLTIFMPFSAARRWPAPMSIPRYRLLAEHPAAAGRDDVGAFAERGLKVASGAGFVADVSGANGARGDTTRSPRPRPCRWGACRRRRKPRCRAEVAGIDQVADDDRRIVVELADALVVGIGELGIAVLDGVAGAAVAGIAAVDADAQAVAAVAVTRMERQAEAVEARVGARRAVAERAVDQHGHGCAG